MGLSFLPIRVGSCTCTCIIGCGSLPRNFPKSLVILEISFVILANFYKITSFLKVRDKLALNNNYCSVAYKTSTPLVAGCLFKAVPIGKKTA